MKTVWTTIGDCAAKVTKYAAQATNTFWTSVKDCVAPVSKWAMVATPLTVTLLGPPVLAQQAGTPDRERIIEIDSLKEVVGDATGGIQARMDESVLEYKFERVNELLNAKDLDKPELLNTLHDLREEMDGFTANWESEVAGPLWNGMDSIARTADQVRAVLARGKSGELGEKVQKRLQQYDHRLTQLADAIHAEADERRRERLRMTFAHVRTLRDLVEAFGRVNLGPTTERVYSRLVEALVALENQLTNAAFQVERVHLVLTTQSEFIGDYTEILAGVIDAEDLAKWLDEMESEGKGIGALATNVEGLTRYVSDFTEGADRLLLRLTESIELQSERFGAAHDPSRGSGFDVDHEIERYRSRK